MNEQQRLNIYENLHILSFSKCLAKVRKNNGLKLLFEIEPYSKQEFYVAVNNN